MRDLYVVVAATRYDGPAYTERHIADALRSHGDVLWLEPPISVFGARRRGDLVDGRTRPGLLRVDDRLTRVVPPTPPAKDRRGVAHLARWLHSRAALRAVRRDGRAPRAVLNFAARFDPLGATSLPGTHRVAWVKDDLAAGADLTGLARGRVEDGRRAMLRRADLVVAASPVLVDRLADEGVDAVLLPAGADVAHYADAEALPRPESVPADLVPAGYVGQLGDRVDVALLESLADSGVPLLLVGRLAPSSDHGRFRDLLAHPAVTWTGPVAYEDLPAHLGTMSVGLIPYRRDEFNLASFPLKMVEYLAAGLPVVSTDLPAARWMNTSVIDVAADGDSWVAAVQRALGGRTEVTRVETRGVAAAHSWDSRVEELLQHLGHGHPDRPPSPED